MPFVSPAASPSALFRAPVGRYLAGRRFVLGFPTPRLQVLIGWGAIGAREASELATVLRAQHERVPRHASLVDLRRLLGVDEPAVAVLAAAMHASQRLNALVTTRSAVVRPPGLSGLAVAGFWQVVDAGYPVRVFVDPAAALRWLGHPRTQITRDLAAWDRLHVACAGGDLTDRLRKLLARRPGLAAAAAARELAVSTRTLQRALAGDATSFRAESEGARVAAALELLRDDERSIKEVAAQVGMTSPSAFAALFRRRTGRSPRAWRLARSRA
jgi:AraC-like DNA-binding protein